MAELDRTFTDEDVIRIYLNNLDEKEKAEVRKFFDTSQIELVEDIIDVALDLIGAIPLIGEVFELLGLVVDIVQLEQGIRSLEATSNTIKRLTGG